jgi:hypothetical protein
MDPKVIEMNNLRVLNDYLNQTLDVLVRGQRFGNGHAAGLGYSPFTGPIPAAAGSLGTDAVYGPSLFGFGGSPLFGSLPHTPFAAASPFTGLPMIGGGYGASYSPFSGWQQAPWGAGQTPWTAGQTPWTAGQASWPVAEAARQAQLNQTLAARQSVLEAMCRVAGIPV